MSSRNEVEVLDERSCVLEGSPTVILQIANFQCVVMIQLVRVSDTNNLRPIQLPEISATG